MTTRKHIFFGSTSLTRNELRLGRMIRDGEGHPVVTHTTENPGPSHEAPSVADALAPEALEPTKVAAPASIDDQYEAEYGAGSTNQEDGDKGTPADPEKPAEEQLTPAEQAAKDRADAADARAEKLERELAEAKKGKEPPKPEAPAPARDQDPAPKAEDYEFGEADSKYLDDRSAWVARQEFQRLTERQGVERQLNDIEAGYDADVAAEDTAQEYPDFADKVTAGADRGDWACSQLMALAIKASPVGKHLAYELASNPKESERIANLVPIEQSYELGILEGQVRARRAAAKANSEVKVPNVASKAPTPPPAKSRGAGGQFVATGDALYDKMLAEF